MTGKWKKGIIAGVFSLAILAAYGNGKGSVVSTILSLAHYAGNVFELVVDCPAPVASYPLVSSNLVDGAWGSIGHSTSSGGPFAVGNLGSVPGTNTIYVESDHDAAFFGIGTP